MKPVLIIFTTVFLAELGDKTQLATLLFATDSKLSPWIVFAAASGALIGSTGLAVILGNVAQDKLTQFPLELVAGLGFIAIGLWSVWGHFSTS